MKRFTKSIHLALSAVLLGLVAQASASADRPNIVWIFAEDMNSWMGCYGDNTVPTPNIDALARGGQVDGFESDAAAAGDATDKLTVTGPEGTEKVEVNEAFEIRMTNTTAFE